MTRGFLLGKFLPPHRGHAYLIRFARSLCDELTVLVCSIAAEPIPGTLRYDWVRRAFGGVRVAHCDDENPQAPDEDPENFWPLWRRSILSRLDAPPDLVFASEPYGFRLAQELGAVYVPGDHARDAFSASGTALRADLAARWDDLLPEARPYFVRRIALVGPESSGKTTLARRLAGHFGTVRAPEYARGYLDAHAGRRTLYRLADSDFRAIVRGHRASAEALAVEANRQLFLDTDALTSVLWARRLLGFVPPEVEEAARAERIDFTLLLSATERWSADPQRCQPDLADRRAFEAELTAQLRARGRPFVRLEGSEETRFAQAVAALGA